MRNISKLSLVLAAIGMNAVAHASGVDANLGSFGYGSVPFSGTTVGADNDIDTYSPAGNPAAIWDQDTIFQFTTTASGLLNLTSNDPVSATADNDYWLLTSLATTTNGSGLRSAISLNTGILDDSGTFGVVPAGTYYLAVDAWRGNPTSAGTPATGRATAFAGTLSLSALTAPASTPVTLGGSLSGTLAAGQVIWYSFSIASPTAVSFDTEGTTLSSTNDTELFLYDSGGNLLGTDDDDGTGNLSILNSGDELPATLSAGTYYLGFGAFNTTGGAAFALTSTSTQTGAFTIHGATIVVPEPTSLAAISLGTLALRRRRTV